MGSLFTKNRYAPGLWQCLAIVSSLIYALSRFVPCSPPDRFQLSTLDNSWQQTLQVAFAQHWQFGRDIIFTFGPWGFMCGGYYPPTFVTSVISWAILSVIFWLGCWQIARHFFAHVASAWLWTMAFVGVAGLPVGQNFDVRLMAWVLILLLLHFFVDDNPFAITNILVVVSSGWLGLTKFTGMITVAAVILIIAGDELLRRRRFPWIILIFAASVVCFWLAAGQGLGSLLPFLRNSWLITSGYTEAMSGAREQDLLSALFFLLVVAVASLPIVYAGFVKYRCFGVLPLGGLGLIILVAFKHGFVRHDPRYEAFAALEVLLIALISWAVSWPHARTRGLRIIAVQLLVLDVALAYSAALFNSRIPEPGFLRQLVASLSPRSLLAPVGVFFHTDDFRSAYESSLAGLRRRFPLPRVSGDVDVYPWKQDVILAHGLPYHPRPIFQSYSAYTPELAELNAAFLRGRHAAENIFFSVGTIDDRFPTLDDGCSWPELLTRYDIHAITNNFIILKRAAVPRKFHLVLIKAVPLHFGESVKLPVVTRAPVWAEMNIRKTGWGSVLSTFYKPAALRLSVSLRNGRQLQFGLIPGLTRTGFLLSPLINDNAAFESLALAGGGPKLAEEEVTAITVRAVTKSGSTICYQSPMELRLYLLDFSPQNTVESGSENELP